MENNSHAWSQFNIMPYSECVFVVTGGTVSVVIDISSSLAVGVSAAVAILYTLMGGLYSVAYTDVIQLSFVLVGLV